MLQVLERWNRWGTQPLASGKKRKILDRILRYRHSKEVIALIGPRRSGKSTTLYQIMDALESEKIPKEAMLHINFEEPKLAMELGLDLLDALYDSYRESIYPQGKAYLFLDEIQNIQGWERWVRARNETEDIKIFLTGSSAKLMSREIASSLTGRHLTFEILPLSLAEFLEFRGLKAPDHRRPIDPPAPIRQALNELQDWGGFPAVTLAQEIQHKRDLLSQYFDDILYRDIALRHDVRDLMLLRSIAVHLLTQTAKRLSFNRIANTFQVSNDLGVSYCRHIQESYMVDFLPYYSMKVSVRQRHPQKVYTMDLGLRRAVGLPHSADEGRLVETLVYHHLRSLYGENIFYWGVKKEIDFLIREGNTITQLWQVVAGGLDDKTVRDRKLSAFEEAKEEFPSAESFLVVKTLPKEPINFSGKVIPLWTLLLDSIPNVSEKLD